MATYKVIATDAEIDKALLNAKELEEPLVSSVSYHQRLNCLILHFADGGRYIIPIERIEGMQGATRKQILAVEILGNGTGLHWPDLNLDLYVPYLLKGISGTQKWMSELGRMGGQVSSPAKAMAARKNGTKGGRPKKAQHLRKMGA